MLSHELLSHELLESQVCMSHQLVIWIGQRVTRIHESSISNQSQSVDHKSDTTVQGSIGPRPITRKIQTGKRYMSHTNHSYRPLIEFGEILKPLNSILVCMSVIHLTKLFRKDKATYYMNYLSHAH